MRLFSLNRQCLPVKQSKALVLKQLGSLMHLNSAGKGLVLLPLHLEGTYFWQLSCHYEYRRRRGLWDIVKLPWHSSHCAALKPALLFIYLELDFLYGPGSKRGRALSRSPSTCSLTSPRAADTYWRSFQTHLEALLSLKAPAVRMPQGWCHGILEPFQSLTSH